MNKHEWVNPNLKPVKNYRYQPPRCCANCKHWKRGFSDFGIDWYCEREGGPVGGELDNDANNMVCDRFARAAEREREK